MDLWWNYVHSGRSKVESGPITQQRLPCNRRITLPLVLSGGATGPKVIILEWNLGCTWRAVWLRTFMEKEKEKLLGTDRGKIMGRLCGSWSYATREIQWPLEQTCNCSPVSRWQRSSFLEASTAFSGRTGRNGVEFLDSDRQEVASSRSLSLWNNCDLWALFSRVLHSHGHEFTYPLSPRSPAPVQPFARFLSLGSCYSRLAADIMPLQTLSSFPHCARGLTLSS